MRPCLAAGSLGRRSWGLTVSVLALVSASVLVLLLVMVSVSM